MPLLSSNVLDHAASLRMSVNVDLSTTLKCLASCRKSIEQSIPVDPRQTSALQLWYFLILPTRGGRTHFLHTWLCTGNNCMLYIHITTALASFEFHGLFCDYVSTQMAEGRDKGNNHLFPQLWTFYLLILPTQPYYRVEQGFLTWYWACLCFKQLCYEKLR